MTVIVGLLIVFLAVFGGFALHGGKFDTIISAAPFELLMIFGAGFGALVIANSTLVFKQAMAGLSKTLKGPKWSDENYKELLGLMFVLIKTMRTKGVVAVEGHIENPEDSKIFQHFSTVSDDHHVVEFIADYMRMMTMNFEDPNQMEDAMVMDLERHHKEEHEPVHALSVLADGLPALGIVAAVLGIIKAMGAISEPVEILGAMIASALVGTFLGIFLSYTIVAPLAGRLGQIKDEEANFLNVVKVVLISYLHGNAPQIAVEIGRRNIPSHLQPAFIEVEDFLSEIPPEL
ncbi:MAG: flagellar motor stator protein MotA [Sphingomonadales bacterium]|nr:flagellar motor stator protein MotA [Sphingomonadales bacterium]